MSDIVKLGRGRQSRLLILCPLADIYSGVGNFGAPPLGPWRLAFNLRHAGQHVDVWDCNVSERLQLPAPEDHAGRDRASALAEAFVAAMEADYDIKSYAWIGFSLLSDTLPTTLGVINLIRKKYPEAKLVGGNHEATVNLNDCLNKSQLDGILLADAEESMLALMQGVSPHEIAGVIWRVFQPKPPREKFEDWNRQIEWGAIPYKSYWDRTASLYNLDAMDTSERLAKLYEIHTVRIHSLVACELSCTYSVAGDTLVFTDDGPVEIAALAQGLGSVRQCVHGGTFVEYPTSKIVSTAGGRGLATRFLDEGIRPVLRVTTEGGFAIRATADHKLLCVVDEQIVWRQVGELAAGDFVVIRRPERQWPMDYVHLTPPVINEATYEHRGSDVEHRCPEVLDERLAWLAGFVVGDGCIPSDGRPAFHFCVFSNLEAKQREIVRDLFNVELKTYPVQHSRKLLHGWVYSRLAREVLIQSLGMKPNEGKLTIPPLLWRSPKAVLSAFIDGLFDADAHVFGAAGYEYLTTVSERLAREVALAMLILGRGCPNIQFVKSTSDEHRDHYRVSVYRQDRLPIQKSVYESESGWRWRTLKQESVVNRGCIGLRRSTLRKSGLHHPLDRDGWYYMRVRSIEPKAAEPVYDITVPDEEAFVANGFVAHNCSVANTRRIASGSMKPSIVNLSPSALRETLLAVKRQVKGVMTIYDSCDEAWLGRGRADEYLGVLESIREEMDAGLPRGMRYLIQCRTNDLDEATIDRASKVGVRHLTIGVESPIEQVRRDIKKPQGEDLIRNVARWCTARDIDAYMLFIMFLPSITLEQLRQAVINWRIYMDLGATISVEPFCMSYLGTALHDDSSYLTEYAGYDIPFSGTPAKKLKWATLIWPTDRRVCAVEQWFREHVDGYIAEALKKLGHRHAFKGTTGRVTVDCLEEALRQWDLGQIPPWAPGEGRKSAVYQDFGDQASGAELATMVRQNKTATRFNSTHALLDDPNAGIKGRIKDPALPHEVETEESK